MVPPMSGVSSLVSRALTFSIFCPLAVTMRLLEVGSATTVTASSGSARRPRAGAKAAWRAGATSVALAWVSATMVGAGLPVPATSSLATISWILAKVSSSQRISSVAAEASAWITTPASPAGAARRPRRARRTAWPPKRAVSVAARSSASAFLSAMVRTGNSAAAGWSIRSMSRSIRLCSSAPARMISELLLGSAVTRSCPDAAAAPRRHRPPARVPALPARAAARALATLWASAWARR